MRNTIVRTALAAGALALAVGASAQQPVPGQDYKTAAPGTTPQTTPTTDSSKSTSLTDHAGMASFTTASHIIGTEVMSDNHERLGKVQDLVVSIEGNGAPFAIIKYGSALGVGGTRVAVPLNELKWSDDNKTLSLAASKEQFDAATTTPSGNWARVSNQPWTKDVDRYYGEPSAMSFSRYERQELTPGQHNREFVRNPGDSTVNAIPSGTSDMALKSRVNKLIEQVIGASEAKDVHASVDKGVVTLKGKIPSDEMENKLKNQIQTLPGVSRVDSELTKGQ
jgi:sporulation protein YlmC with PRC-barrel domain